LCYCSHEGSPVSRLSGSHSGGRKVGLGFKFEGFFTKNKIYSNAKFGTKEEPPNF